MKYALADGQRREAQPGLSGECISCTRPMVAKCGEIKIWHWAHIGKRVCDPWWENETQWHRDWKGQFPFEWQEIVHHAETGEKHIADVKTAHDWVIEFQHSYLKPEERRARDAFYSKLVWVVDGTRRKRDQLQFSNMLKDGRLVNAKPLQVWKVFFPEECALLWEWANGSALVFFDFGEESKLWGLLPMSTNGEAYILELSRTAFIELYRSGTAQMAQDFAENLKTISNIISDHTSRMLHQPVLQPQNRQLSFQQCLARQKRTRRRF